jgi:hypothetical protein
MLELIIVDLEVPRSIRGGGTKVGSAADEALLK